jgi:hypothetical protein
MKSVVGSARSTATSSPVEAEGSDIEAGIWACGVRPPDPSSNVQRTGEQGLFEISATGIAGRRE